MNEIVKLSKCAPNAQANAKIVYSERTVARVRHYTARVLHYHHSCQIFQILKRKSSTLREARSKNKILKTFEFESKETMFVCPPQNRLDSDVTS